MHKLLTSLLILFFLLLILIKFWLINIPEFIPIGSEFGEIVENIAISYIAAYIFYLMQVWYPHRLKEKVARNKFISPLESIKCDLEKVIKVFNKNENPYDIQEINKESIENINLLPRETPYAFAYGVEQGRIADYIEYLEHIHDTLARNIEKINYWNDFDIELRELLQRIEDCELFNFKDNKLKARRMLKPDEPISASIITNELIDLHKSFKELINYIPKNEKRIKKLLSKGL